MKDKGKKKNKTKSGVTASEIGKKGGDKTKKRYGHDHYVRIGTMGGQKMKEIIAAGKSALKRQMKGEKENKGN